MIFNSSLGLIPDSITYSPCCPSYLTRWPFVKQKTGEKKEPYTWKAFVGNMGIGLRATGQLGDISASGQLDLTLTQWATHRNKAYPYPSEQYKDSPPCFSFL